MPTRTLDTRTDAAHGHIASLRAISDQLVRRLTRLSFAEPVAYVYNPLDYARAAWDQYIELYSRPGVRCLLLGMNPGPWGMVQTGVPFGEVTAAREFLRIDAPIRRPKVEHPKRPVLGMSCTRSEVSGARLWGWARDRYDSADAFFRRFFVANYCPLAFLEATGRNRTPDKLPVIERQPLLDACDEALRELVRVLSPEHVIGVGQFAEARAGEALAGMDVKLDRILHPSPASPAANRDWSGEVTRKLASLGLLD